MDKGNMVLSSNNSKFYLDGVLVAELSKAEAKATKESEDINFVGDNRTYKRSKGFKVEGSLTIKKINSDIAGKVADSIRSGIELDSKIIAVQANTEGEAERIALYGVDFGELQLFSMEANAIIEQEFPFTAVDFEYLDRINKK